MFLEKFFMEPEGVLPCSQIGLTALAPCREPVEPNPHSISILIFSSHIRLGQRSGLVP